MHENQRIYRELWDALLGTKSDDVYYDLIQPWLRKTASEKVWLVKFSKRSGQPYPDATIEDLWRLYALNRVNDVCLLGFQPRIDPEASRNNLWDGPNITLGEYLDLFLSLGLYIKDRDTFHPFYHEIVAVEETDKANAPIEIIETLWPCLMLGDMMFSRAGVVVRGGEDYIRKKIAQSSTMYWTYWRKYKMHQDLSVGWGSNSQWRTEFRRDYFVEGHYYYNVDVEPIRRIDLSNHLVSFDASRVGNATRLERIELVRHRSFIHAQIQPDNDLWPYDDFFRETE